MDDMTEYQRLLAEQNATAEVVGQSRPPEKFDPTLGFGKQEPLTENKVMTLNDLMLIVGEARQHGIEVTSCDDPRRLGLGFIVEGTWHYISLVRLKESMHGVTPEVAAMFGLEPKDIRDYMRTPTGRHFLATGSRQEESPPLADTKPLTEAWVAEADKDKPIPCRVDFPDGLEGAPVLVPDDGTPEIPRPPKKE